MALTNKINKIIIKYESGVFCTALGGGLSLSGFISAWPQEPETLDKFLYNSWGYGGVALALYGLSWVANEMFKERYNQNIWDVEIGFKRRGK